MCDHFDLNPVGDSFPEQFTSYQGSLYFVATTPATGYEVWRFDGVQVNQVTDINLGPGDAYPQGLTVAGTELCFSARDDDYADWELWSLHETGGGAGVLEVAPADEKVFTGHIGGPFIPAQYTWVVTNTGTATLVFSAKESVFKCLHPFVRRYFGFHAARVVEAREGRFTALLTETLTTELPEGLVLEGRYAVSETHVHTGLALVAQR